MIHVLLSLVKGSAGLACTVPPPTTLAVLDCGGIPTDSNCADLADGISSPVGAPMTGLWGVPAALNLSMMTCTGALVNRCAGISRGKVRDYIPVLCRPRSLAVDKSCWLMDRG